MGESIRQDLQDRMGAGTTIVHQASGWLAQPKRMFRAGERKRGTFLVLSRPEGALPVFLAVDAEVTMNADVLPLRGLQSTGDGVALQDGRRLIFSGGSEAASMFIGSYIQHSS